MAGVGCVLSDPCCGYRRAPQTVRINVRIAPTVPILNSITVSIVMPTVIPTVSALYPSTPQTVTTLHPGDHCDNPDLLLLNDRQMDSGQI